MSFSKNVREMIKLRGISVSELSRRSKVVRQEIYLVLKGEQPPTMALVKRLGNGLGCTPGWLLRK